MEISVLNMNGEKVNTVELPETVFEAKVNVGLMHQAVVRQQANARRGTHNSKTRGEVALSTRKIYRQKGTGRARHGRPQGAYLCRWRQGARPQAA